MSSSNSSSSGPRAGGPRPRRSFIPVQKLEFLAAYENACENGEGGAFLRREGLYSSQMSEWRRLRDAGVLAGKKAGESIGKLSTDQAENARLRRQLAVQRRCRAVTGESRCRLMFCLWRVERVPADHGRVCRGRRRLQLGAADEPVS